MTFLRLCAVILCISSSLIAYSQNRVDFKFNRSTNTYTVPGSDKHYYVFNYPGLSQHELFNRVKMAINEIGKDYRYLNNWGAYNVTDNMLHVLYETYILTEEINYSEYDRYIRATVIFKFKDGKIRVNAPTLWRDFDYIERANSTQMHEINSYINAILTHIETENDW